MGLAAERDTEPPALSPSRAPVRPGRSGQPERVTALPVTAALDRPEAGVPFPTPVDARPNAGRDPLSAARQTGTAFESVVTAYLAAHGFPHVERRTLHGSADRGDIAGVAGWAIECKAVRSMDLAGWASEATREAANAHTLVGCDHQAPRAPGRGELRPAEPGDLGRGSRR